MSSSSTLLSLQIAIQQVFIYFSLFVFVTGVIGNTFNIVIFTTLRTFRETSSAFYLTTASFVNILYLLGTVLLSTFSIGFNIGTDANGWFCKIRFFLVQWLSLMSLTAICLATVDQFISMTYPNLSSLKVAYRHIVIASFVWLLHGIFFLVYWDTYNGQCVILNEYFAKYYSYFYLPVLVGCLPITVMILFGLLAFLNARSLTSRQVNIVRLARDRQLTAMVLVQVVFVVFVSLPFLITYIYSLNLNITEPEYNARITLARGVTFLLYAEIYAVSLIILTTDNIRANLFKGSFYIYMCVSERFRKQFMYVLIDVHLNRWRQRSIRLNNNQVVPLPSK